MLLPPGGRNDLGMYWLDVQRRSSSLSEATLPTPQTEAALTLAWEAHDGQKRKSGEPYIIHPVAVACILGDLGMDAETVIAGLLHDTVRPASCISASGSLTFRPACHVGRRFSLATSPAPAQPAQPISFAFHRSIRRFPRPLRPSRLPTPFHALTVPSPLSPSPSSSLSLFDPRSRTPTTSPSRASRPASAPPCAASSRARRKSRRFLRKCRNKGARGSSRWRTSRLTTCSRCSSR